MYTITDSTNYIQFSEGNDSLVLVKASIVKVVLKEEKDCIFIYTTDPTNYEVKIEYSKVSSPATADVTTLFNTIIGYL